MWTLTKENYKVSLEENIVNLINIIPELPEKLNNLKNNPILRTNVCLGFVMDIQWHRQNVIQAVIKDETQSINKNKFSSSMLIYLYDKDDTVIIDYEINRNLFGLSGGVYRKAIDKSVPGWTEDLLCWLKYVGKTL